MSGVGSTAGSVTADRRGVRPDDAELGAWLDLADDGTVTVYTGKVEVGQHIRTSLAQIVADELGLPPDRVHLVMGDTDRVPFDSGTFGSRTTPTMGAQLRKVAAATRELLLDLAAERWGVGRDELSLSTGKICHAASGRSVPIAELAGSGALRRHVPVEMPTIRTPPQASANLSGAGSEAWAAVTGQHQFTPDVSRPGMLRGTVLRPSRPNSSLVTVDVGGAGAISGATVVRDGAFVGVVAPNEHIASKAIQAIRAEWTTPESPEQSELFDYLRTHPAESTGNAWSSTTRHDQGDLATGRSVAEYRFEQTYTVAYIAHAPLEPRAAVAEWEDGKLTVWTGTQRPFGVRSQLAETFAIPEEQVRVIVPDTGSGYGGKHQGDAALEAARLAKSAGKPVKLVWTREEEFTFAYFRPAGAIDIASAVRSDGAIAAWEFHNFNSGAAGIRTPYDVPNQRIEYHPAKPPFRQGSYRALSATANHFAREVHMDELSHAIGQDPLAFRLRNLRDPRMRAVLEAAAERFDWGRTDPLPHHGAGLAVGTEKGSYVATCAEVAVNPTSGRVTVVRVTEAFECGAIVSPDNLRNQIEGAIVQGLGGALYERIDFADGKILNPRFSRYRVPRFADVPRIETVLIDRRDLPSAGAGETPIIGIAPAVSNAIFAATGRRLRSLPMLPDGVLPTGR